MLSTAICVWAGLHMPAGVTWGDLTIVGIIGGIGFTVALFFATAAFPPGHLLDQTKMGALLSFSASLLALIAAYIRSATMPQLLRPRRPRHR